MYKMATVFEIRALCSRLRLWYLSLRLAGSAAEKTAEAHPGLMQL